MTTTKTLIDPSRTPVAGFSSPAGSTKGSKYWFISTKLFLNSGSVPFKLAAEKASEWSWCNGGERKLMSQWKMPFGTSGITETFFWSRLQGWEGITSGGKISELPIYFWFNQTTLFFMSPWRHFSAWQGEMCSEWAAFQKRSHRPAVSVSSPLLIKQPSAVRAVKSNQSGSQVLNLSFSLSVRLWFFRRESRECHNSSVGFGLHRSKGKMEEFGWRVMNAWKSSERWITTRG